MEAVEVEAGEEEAALEVVVVVVGILVMVVGCLVPGGGGGKGEDGDEEEVWAVSGAGAYEADLSTVEAVILIRITREVTRHYTSRYYAMWLVE